MLSLQLPGEIHSGIDALEKIFDKDYESVLIISDGKLSQQSGALLKLRRKFDAMMTGNEAIISDNAQELFDRAKKYADSHIPEAIIAVGDGKTLDCGSAVSKLCGIPLISVIETLPCALCEFETLDLFLYKNAPDICIADPSFISLADSSKIAYEALGMSCLALESAVTCPDRYISSVASKAFYEIMRNILPSFRGEISARENLCSAMLAAYTAYINSFEYSWQSAAFRTASFFSQWNSDRIGILAVSAVNLAEYFCENYSDSYFALAQSFDLTPLDEIASSYLTGEIRRIQASMSVPFAVRHFMPDENDFDSACAGLSDTDRDLALRCYYGNITFIKS